MSLLKIDLFDWESALILSNAPLAADICIIFMNFGCDDLLVFGSTSKVHCRHFITYCNPSLHLWFFIFRSLGLQSPDFFQKFIVLWYYWLLFAFGAIIKLEEESFSGFCFRLWGELNLQIGWSFCKEMAKNLCDWALLSATWKAPLKSILAVL